MRTRLTLVAVVMAFLMGSSALRAWFHFELIRSTPSAGVTLKTAPKRLQLWFTQVPAEGVSKITLLRGDAAQSVAKTTIVKDDKSMYVDLDAPLAAGAYVIAWRGAGDDGHVQTGRIPFTVAAPRQ